jgi:hypothetical protein
MAAKSHALGPGSLKLGETGSSREIAQQLTKIVLTPNVDEEDDVPVLSGEILDGEETTTWEVSGTANQDYDADSFEDWCFTNRGKRVPFEFTPSTAHVRGYKGTLKVRPIAVGGDVKKKNTSDFTFPLVGEPVQVTGPGTPA